MTTSTVTAMRKGDPQHYVEGINKHIYIYQNEGVPSGVFDSWARWMWGSWFGISLYVCLFVCLFVCSLGGSPGWVGRPSRDPPSLGRPTPATHPATHPTTHPGDPPRRPTPSDPPLVLIAFWRVYGTTYINIVHI